MNSNKPLIFAFTLYIVALLPSTIISPALPSMASDFGTAEKDVQVLLTYFLLSAGLSQLIYGYLADSLGRKKTLILGQVIFVTGSALAAFRTDSLLLMTVGVILQAFGSGGNQVVARCLISDTTEGAKLNKSFALFGMIGALVPIIAPIFGGYISDHLGWKYIYFLIMVTVSAVFIISALSLEETQKSTSKVSVSLSSLFSSYWSLLKNRTFLLLLAYFWFAGILSMYLFTAFPFILSHEYQSPATSIGFFMGVPGVGIVLAASVCSKLNSEELQLKLLNLGSFLPILAGALLYFVQHEVSVMATLFIAGASIGVIFPVVTALTMGKFKGQAGVAAALPGASQMIISAIVVTLMHSLMAINSHNAAMIFTVITAGLLVLNLVQKRS